MSPEKWLPVVPVLAKPNGTRRANALHCPGSHFSGDIFLAFSTAEADGLTSVFPIGPPSDDEFGTLRFVPWGRMDAFYTAVVQSVEEAVLNALVVNEDMVGRDGHRSPRLPIEALSALLG